MLGMATDATLRITEQSGIPRLDEPTPSEVRQPMKLVKANAVQRATGGAAAAPRRLSETDQCQPFVRFCGPYELHLSCYGSLSR
jgi:hypothetical protein